MCSCAGKSVFQTVVRIFLGIPLFCFGFGFLDLSPSSFLKPDRHVALRPDLMRTSMAMSMLRTNWYQNLMTTLEQQEVRSCPFCKKMSSSLWPTVVFDRWPTHRYIRVLRRACPMIELQACHRVFAAPSRSDQDRERILVLPHLFALLHWPLPPLISAVSQVILSSTPFCSACALMLWSRPRIHVSLEIVKWALALSWLQLDCQT